MALQLPRLFVSLSLPFAAGFIGSLFTMPAIESWYTLLKKPDFSPPNWVFGPVWTLLYVLMGIALYLIWNTKVKHSALKTIAFFLFGLQLVLNTLWSIVFFGLKIPEFAFLEIVLLWVAIGVTGLYFYRINKTAGLLFIPYIFWVSFATILNLFIVILN